MCITHRASPMEGCFHWLEMSTCFRAVHRFFRILVTVGSRSRREESRQSLVVTTSNHCLVDMADFGDDLEIECDALAAKRSHDGDDTSSGERDRTSVRSASSESDADDVPRKRRRRGAYHKLEEGRINLRSFS